MKILKSRHDLLWFFSIIFFIASFISLLAAPRHLINLGYLSWIFVAACIWQFFRAENSAPTNTFKKAFLLISLFQFAFFAIFYGICKISGLWLINYSVAQPQLFSQTLRLLWWHFGLFPWPAVAIFSAALSKSLQNADTYPHRLLPKYFDASSDNRFGLLINAANRMGIILLLSLIIGFSALGLLYLSAPNMTRNLLGFQPVILILLLALFAFLASKRAENYWRQLQSYILFTPFIIIPGLTLLLTLILFIFLAAALSFVSNASAQVNLVSSLAHIGWLHYWFVFAFCFWILSIIPLSLWIAAATRNLCPRKILLSILCWPFIFSLLLNFHWNFRDNATFDCLILFAGAVVLAGLLTNQVNWQTTSRGYIEKDLVKNRPATRLLRNISMLSLLVVYLFWQSNIIGLDFVLWFISLPLIALLLLSSFV